MITPSTLRRALAAPAALTLALGGALLGATSASAVDGQLVVSTPTAAQELDSRIVTVSGTAAPSSSILIYDGDSIASPLLGTAAAGETGAWSTAVSFPAEAPAAQTITVSGTLENEPFDTSVQRSFTIPAPAVDAPVTTLTLATPVEGSTEASRTVVFSGTAPAGSRIEISNGTVLVLGGTLAPDSTTFSFPVTLPAAFGTPAAFTVTAVTPDGLAVGATNRTITVPPADAAPVTPFDVTEPAEGTPLTSRTVTFSGTGSTDSVVTATDADGAQLAEPVTVVDDAWTLDVVFADDAATEQTVTFTQTTAGVASGAVVVDLTLPAAAPQPIVLATPVFTAPVEGEVVVGDRVTFQGTGTPGADIGVIAVPTAQIAQLEDDLAALFPEPQVSTLAQPDPQPAPADPAARIIVGEDGTWSVTISALPEDYTAVAISALLEDDGTVALDPVTGLPVVSAPSEALTFSVVAAVAAPAPGTTPAGTTPVATRPGGLAYTGTEAGGALGLAAALALAGTALTLVARRRRALATVDADQQ